MPFAPTELVRYSRHILLAEVGGEGQDAIRAARVFLLGRGLAGRIAASYLVAAGVGRLCLLGGVEALPFDQAVTTGQEVVRLPEPADAPSLARILGPGELLGAAGDDELVSLARRAAMLSGALLAIAPPGEGDVTTGALVATEALRRILGLVAARRAFA